MGLFYFFFSFLPLHSAYAQREGLANSQGKKKNQQYLSERTMEVWEQVSTFSMKMKSLFHAIRAAKLWNSFPVGGSGGKRENAL